MALLPGFRKGQVVQAGAGGRGQIIRLLKEQDLVWVRTFKGKTWFVSAIAIEESKICNYRERMPAQNTQEK